VIQSLTQTMGTDLTETRDYLDSCRIKRNISDYDTAGVISHSTNRTRPLPRNIAIQQAKLVNFSVDFLQ